MDPFLAEIRIFPFSFAPKGWALCNGQLLPISQNAALYSLIGAYYGGNGTTNFALPNLQGSAPVGAGQGPGLSNYPLGQVGGAANVTLSAAQIPAHSHPLGAAPDPAETASPAGNILARSVGGNLYVNGTPNAALASSVGTVGGNAAHNNLPPYQVFNFCIALQGIYPSRP